MDIDKSIISQIPPEKKKKFPRPAAAESGQLVRGLPLWSQRLLLPPSQNGLGRRLLYHWQQRRHRLRAGGNGWVYLLDPDRCSASVSEQGHAVSVEGGI